MKVNGKIYRWLDPPKIWTFLNLHMQRESFREVKTLDNERINNSSHFHTCGGETDGSLKVNQCQKSPSNYQPNSTAWQFGESVLLMDTTNDYELNRQPLNQWTIRKKRKKSATIGIFKLSFKLSIKVFYV